MKLIAKKMTVALVLTAFSGPAFAGDPKRKENCIGGACASRKAADFENEARSLAKKHPENAALRELTKNLQGKSPTQQNALVKTYFQLDQAADETAVEKAIDRKLNDNSGDKLTNAEVLRLADVLTGARD